MNQPSIEAKVAFLKHVPLFHGFEDRLLAVLAGILDLRRLPAGTELCQEGGPGDACFIVGHGEIEVLRAKGEGILCTLGPGHTVGEVALVDGKKRSATVRCKTDASVFFLRRDDFDQLFRAGNHASLLLLDNIAQSLASRVRIVNERYAEIFSRAGDTITELGKRLAELQATVEGDGQSGNESADLMKILGYVGHGVPTAGRL